VTKASLGRWLLVASVVLSSCSLLGRGERTGPTLARGEPLVVSTLAGKAGQPGRRDGETSSALFDRPTGLVLDLDGSLLVTDEGGNSVRRVDDAGRVTTVANPSGEPGTFDGGFLQARLRAPRQICVAPDRGVFLAEAGNHRIRRLGPFGQVETIAGLGNRGGVDGPLLLARFDTPSGVVLDGKGRLVIADSGNHSIRVITEDRVTRTLAGGGEPGFVDGKGSEARFHSPADLGLALDTGAVLVADAGNHAIRRIDGLGNVTTLAGDGQPGLVDGRGGSARFSRPSGLCVGGRGEIYVADTGNNAIRVIEPDGAVITLAGGKGEGYRDGGAGAALFSSPLDVLMTQKGALVVADGGNHVLRLLSPLSPPADSSRR